MSVFIHNSFQTAQAQFVGFVFFFKEFLIYLGWEKKQKCFPDNCL